MIFAGGGRGRSAMDSDAMSEISEMSSKSKKPSRFRTNKKKDTSKDLSKSQKEALKAQMRLDKALAAANMDEFPSPDDKEDPALRFAGDGVTFKAKLIGVDPVTGPRGDQMCRNAMTRLKAIIKGTGSHKQKIILSISLDGLKLMDEKTRETVSQHPIPLISYISRDTSDSRAFGFVYGSPSEGHQFIGIKTEKQAIPVMQTIADLFTYVYEKRKKEKAKDKENNRGEPVLSFNPKEEVFSEQKVNAAWKQSEPKITNRSSSSSSSPVSIPVLPPPLPPPRSAAESISSRASTLNSSQTSEMLSDLRAMRHVIQSAHAATSDTSSNDRYATWESFNEAEANDTIGNFQSHLQQHNRNGGMGSAMSIDSNRPSSAISDRSYSGRGGIAPRLPSSVLPVVPSPPSSPRSSVSARARMRPRPGFEQPNQVALPPPNVTVGASTRSLQARSGMYPLQPAESSSSVFPSTAAYHQAHSINSTFPAQSTPDLFSQFNQRVSSNTTDKFEVNFDAVFSSFPSEPSSSHPATSVSSTNVGTLFGTFSPLTSAMTATTTTQSTYSISSSTSTLTSASTDRYACLLEIQNLANYPSIFDNNPASSGSDSDTFVGSPPSSSAEKVSKANGLSESSDLFGGATDWSTSVTNTQGPNAAGLGGPLIPAPRTEDQYTVERPSLIDLNRQDSFTSATQSEHDNSQLNKSPRFVDTATSPGTPPSSSSHANKIQSKGQQINRGSADAFAMSSLLVELDGNKANLSDSAIEKSHDTSGNRSKDTTAIMTKRVCHTENVEDRAVSPASSIASNHSRNPFVPEEETDRLGDFATDATGSSAHRSGGAVARPSPYSTSSSSTSKGVAPCGHPCFDPFSCHHHGHASPFDASQFPSPRQFPPSQFMWHPYHGMPHPPSMYPLPPHPPHECPQCSSGFCYRPDYFHYDMRYPQQYKQNAMYYSQQVFSSPQSSNKPTHPTEFGPSFEFESDFDSKSPPSETHSFQPIHHSHRPHHIFHSETESNRSLSPNNPFNPVFPAPGSHTSESGPVPPPRPPARTEARRLSQESDTPPPPLPKRKPVNGPVPQPMGHFYPYAMYGYPPGPIHPGPDMHQHPYHAGTDAPPIPLPSRKKTGSTSKPGSGSTIERRVSFDAPLPRPPPEDPFDPFNVTYVDKELNRLSTIKRQASMETQKTSTPINSAGGPVPPLLPINAHSISTIRSMEGSQSGQSESHNLQNDSDSVFFSSPSGGPTPATAESGSGGTEAEDVAYTRLDDLEGNKKDESKMNTKDDKQESATEIAKTTTMTTTTNTGSAGAPISFNHFGEDHISPPERNIFREKDPFADDDFFAPTTTT